MLQNLNPAAFFENLIRRKSIALSFNCQVILQLNFQLNSPFPRATSIFEYNKKIMYKGSCYVSQTESILSKT